MKRIIVFFILFSGISLTTFAQEVSKHALGIRFGDNNGFGGEISYQQKLSDINRFELDLGYRNQTDYDAYKLTGIYQWVWNIDNGFNWYAGFGAGIGSWNDSILNSTRNDGLFINAVGDVGIEYNFDIPLLISLDFRPEIGVIGDYGKNTDLDFALSLRYQF
jgi:hypothetical protein